MGNGMMRGQAGSWLPEQDDLEEWLADLAQRAEHRSGRPRHKSVAMFEELLASEPLLRMQAEQMIAEEPSAREYDECHLTSVEQLLDLIDEILDTAPEFSSEAMVMVPLNAVLDWTMGTRSGLAFYRDPRVNTAIQGILAEWGKFLSGPDSRYVLNDGKNGWLGEEARETIGLDQFVHDPEAEYAGFASWNDFFTRHFKDGERPVASPKDDRVIANACESTPYALATDVQRCDEFWAKGDTYSLEELLAHDPVVDELVGGTVYQAFLSATEYHRWHAPVSGTVERAFVVPGTYYSESDKEGEDDKAPDSSQGYLAHVATRAVIIIRADNDVIGPVALVTIGMGDVSSCIIGKGIKPGAHVTKGDEVGYFQFGGSTHCVIAGPGAIESFALGAVPHPEAKPVKVRALLATAPAK